MHVVALSFVFVLEDEFVLSMGTVLLQYTGDDSLYIIIKGCAEFRSFMKLVILTPFSTHFFFSFFSSSLFSPICFSPFFLFTIPPNDTEEWNPYQLVSYLILWE